MTQSRLGKTVLFAALSAGSSAFGNLFLSWGLKRSAASLWLPPIAFLEMFSNLWIVLGVCLLIIWLLSRLALLSWADLSYVLPVTSSAYVLSVVMGKLFFAEQVSWQRWAGSLLIFAGTSLVSSTPPRTTDAKPGKADG